MKFHDIVGSDPHDAFIGRTLKIWIHSFPRPGEDQKARLLRTAAIMETKNRGPFGFWLLTIASLKWLVENLFLGSADQPMVYSLAAEHAYSRNSNMTILMAKRIALDSYPIQMGIACFCN